MYQANWMFISLLILMMMLAGSRPLINTMLDPTIQFRLESYNQLCVLFFVEIMWVNVFSMVNCFQAACVENVLDSVVMSLQRDQNRKFVFAEMVKHWSLVSTIMFQFSFWRFCYLLLTKLHISYNHVKVMSKSQSIITWKLFSCWIERVNWIPLNDRHFSIDGGWNNLQKHKRKSQSLWMLAS